MQASGRRKETQLSINQWGKINRGKRRLQHGDDINWIRVLSLFCVPVFVEVNCLFTSLFTCRKHTCKFSNGPSQFQSIRVDQFDRRA